MTERSVRAITFDFWDTLVRSDTAAFRVARRLAISEVFAEHGFSAERDAIEAAFDHAVGLFDSAWSTNEQFTGHHAIEAVLDLLGHSPPAEVRQRIIDAYMGAGREVPVELTPNIGETLEALKSAGLRVGIICDVALTPSTTLRHLLEQHGLLGHFDHWSFSDEVGVYKPDPAIFRDALAGLGGVDPAEAAHIGDLRRTDVAGARAMGMLALRYRGSNDDDDESHGPEADVVVDDHAELLTILRH
ncbi:MAG: HAD family hydrolase [Acidobacteria bacterium]|nr:HAD family hydrolase [Acidobacteriota bacterium]